MTEIFLSDRMFNLTEIERNKIDNEFIEECMNSLHRLPRFLGYTNVVWSVADHLFLCDYIFNKRFYENLVTAEISEERISNLRKMIFLHDFHEAIIGDIPNPVKKLINENSDNFVSLLEARIDRLFYNHFDVYKDEELYYIVKDVDYCAYVAESNYLTKNIIYDKYSFVSGVDTEISWILEMNPNIGLLKKVIMDNEPNKRYTF